MRTGHITPAEWRWVVVASSLLVMLAFVPFIWVLVSGLTGSEWQFMGALHDYQGGALHLSQVIQGMEGAWQTYFLHTPEPHDSAWIAPLYALLGQMALFTSISSIVIFHTVRVIAALFMYIALYILAANIWMRLRSRRIFFVIAAVGSGFGWLLVPLMQQPQFLDVVSPQAFPFYSTLVNVHFPLAIGLMALTTTVLVMIFRPGEVRDPRPNGDGLLIVALGFLTALVYPLAFIPIAIASALNIIAYWYRWKQIPLTQMRWWIWYVLPAVPFIAYDIAVLMYNPVVSEVWWLQNSVPAPNPLIFVLSFGLPLIVALPGIYRAVRRFEPDGDQFMLLWIIVTVLLVYLPTQVQQRFLIGFMIPLAYFATRSLEDFWFEYVRRRWRLRLLVGLLPVVAATHVLVLILPLRPISTGDFSNASGILLQRDYFVAFDWLRRNTGHEDVLLASPEASLWLPVWTGARTVYGHPTVTLNPAEKRRAVQAWYAAGSTERCEMLLRGAMSYDDRAYTVRYVLYGPQERRWGESACLAMLQPVNQFGQVRVYRYREG